MIIIIAYYQFFKVGLAKNQFQQNYEKYLNFRMFKSQFGIKR